MKIQYKCVIAILPILLTANLIGQSEILPKKQLDAYLTTEEIKIDGIFDERAWEVNSIANGFVQYEPEPGLEATFDSNIKIIYDNEAIYIAAFLIDEEPSKILTEYSLRDDLKNADNFAVILDTYKSGQNGFGFVVSASDIQRDYIISNDTEDYSWNAVWESKTMITDNGWQIEMKIPYAAIRFPDKPIQEWNIQFGREIRRFREKSYWNPINRELNVFLIQAGELHGIKNIKTPTRLSFTPFIATYLNTSHNPKSGNSNVNTAYNAGMDLKYGISDAFTLDMTLIPDFGQTITDKQVLNLSPFEVFFEENRQFFTEGIELFNNQNLFYTRRIGGVPFNFSEANMQLRGDEEIIDNPNIAHLYNATKITGRTKNGTGIGFFNALEKEQFATLRSNTGQIREVKTNPLTNYNVFVIDQNLPNNSVVRLMNANVVRKGNSTDANNTGINVDLKTKDQGYKLEFEGLVSQRFSDGNTDIGYAHNGSISKISGNVVGEVQYGFKSYNFNTNDLGLLFSANEKYLAASVGFQEFNPENENLQLYRYTLSGGYGRLHKPNEFTGANIGFDVFYLFKSRFAFGVNSNLKPVETRDYFEPRTTDFSLFLQIPKNLTVGGFISSDYRKPFALDARTNITLFDSERSAYTVSIEPRFRFNDKFTLKFISNYIYNVQDQGFVGNTILDNKLTPQIGTRDRQIFTNTLSGNYIFNNKMGVNFFIRHYWDKVKYEEIDALVSNGILINTDLQDFTPFDVNYNFFSMDIQYLWRFAPGSDISILWKNIIESEGSELNNDYFQNFGTLFDNTQFNNFSVKIIYYLDYNKLVN